MWGMANGEFKKLSGQNVVGETKRIDIENQLGELGKVIDEQTIGSMETKGRAMEKVYRKLETCRFGKFEGGAKIRERKSGTEIRKQKSGTKSRERKADTEFWKKRMGEIKFREAANFGRCQIIAGWDI